MTADGITSTTTNAEEAIPMTTARFRKKPVEVAAVRWTGSNEAELVAFTNRQFSVIDPADRWNSDDPDATAQVLDSLHSTWVLVQTGDWIIRGVQGEFYPCRSDVFEATYEAVA